MFKPFLFQLRADTWFTLDNLGSADAIERSIDQTLFPVEFSACCQAAQQQGNCVETRKILKVFSLLFACSGLLVAVGVVGRLGNYFKLLESKEDNQRVPKSSQLSDLKNEQEGELLSRENACLSTKCFCLRVQTLLGDRCGLKSLLLGYPFCLAVRLANTLPVEPAA